MSTKGPALSLLVYPSLLAQPGRITKITHSLHTQERFERTETLRVDSTQLPARESLAPGIELKRIRGASIRERFGALRLLLFWQMRVYWYYRHKDVETVATQSLFLLLMVYILTYRTGAVFAYNAHEPETETIASKGLRQKIQRLIEKHWIYKAGLVSVVNEPIGAWYRQAYPGISPVMVASSPLNVSGTAGLGEHLRAPEDRLLYIHVGYLTSGRSIPLLLEVFTKTKSAEIVFLGDRIPHTEVEAAAQAHSDVRWMASVAPEEVVSYVCGADVSLCLIEDLCLSMAPSSPSKLMESLAAQVPSLYSDLVEARGPSGEGASTWVLEDAETELVNAIAGISHKDMEALKVSPPPVPAWENQVKGLEAAYDRALEARSENKLSTRGWSCA